MKIIKRTIYRHDLPLFSNSKQYTKNRKQCNLSIFPRRRKRFDSYLFFIFNENAIVKKHLSIIPQFFYASCRLR